MRIIQAFYTYGPPGFTFGVITEPNGVEPADWGDAYVVAPDDSRAGIVWVVGSGEPTVVCEPDQGRWGVYRFYFPGPATSEAELVGYLRGIVPQLKEYHRLALAIRCRIEGIVSAQEYLSKWLRWERGRQQTGYDKLLLMAWPFIIPFDCYLLKFPVGSSIPPHRDPVKNGRHFRLNVVLRRSASGGEFICDAPIWRSKRVNLFRSDLCVHSVTTVVGHPRYVLSIGWVLRS